MQRHHWLNTYVGILDAAFHLSDMEQMEVLSIIKRLLEGLHVPDRGAAHSLPAPVGLELASGFYTIHLAHTRDSVIQRPVWEATSADLVVSAEAWRDALTGMLFTAYPDLSYQDRILATKTFADLLAALGVPARAAAFLPEAVTRAFRSSPEAEALYTPHHPSATH